MVLYNIIRLTLITSLIIYLISPDVEQRLSFVLAFTTAFFLPASISITTTYHGDWQIAAVSELFRFLIQLAVCYLFTGRGMYYFVKYWYISSCSTAFFPVSQPSRDLCSAIGGISSRVWHSWRILCFQHCCLVLHSFAYWGSCS